MANGNPVLASVAQQGTVVSGTGSLGTVDVKLSGNVITMTASGTINDKASFVAPAFKVSLRAVGANGLVGRIVSQANPAYSFSAVLNVVCTTTGEVNNWALIHIDSTATAMDEYVFRRDDSYGWVELPEYRISGKYGNHSYTGYMLNMTSQRWLTDADYSANSESKALWRHWLVVIVPDHIDYTRNATLYITGGNVNSGPPQASDEDIWVAATLAMEAGVVTGALFGVPNEHTTFALDPKQQSRTEDAIIAYTWDHFINHPDQPDWLVRFPMVKASLRAMDAIKQFSQQTFPELESSFDYFVVAGASKRGWTTWCVGAMDTDRVAAIVPIVLDAINFVEVMHHQFKSYGAWSFALGDYADMDIMARIDDPNMNLLQQMEDPYFYKQRLTMPKMVANAVLDEFQQPDDTHYWWAGMPSPKKFLMTPNAEHSEATGIFELVPAISAWSMYLLENRNMPTFDWTISNTTGEIVVTLDRFGIVEEASVWWAYSCGKNVGNDVNDGRDRRDFRVAMADSPCTCGIAYDGYCGNLKSFWQKETLNETTIAGRRTYSAKFDAPADGRYIAYMISISYLKPQTTTSGGAGQLVAASSSSSSPCPLSLESERVWGRARSGDKKDRRAPTGPGGVIPPIPHDLRGRLDSTTEVSVWPDTFPYADCTGRGCGNSLC